MDINEVFSKISKHKPTILGENIRVYSILIPLLKKNDEIHVLFEVRSMELRSQPGEICFPGGKMEESDQSPMETSIRETTEELGIERKAITRVHPLDYFVQSMEGRIIYPFVGWIDAENFKPNPDEVKEIFTVPLSYLLNVEPEKYPLQFQIEENKQFPYHLIPGGKNYQFRSRKIMEYFYFYEDYIIWGLTAKILNHFISVITKDE